MEQSKAQELVAKTGKMLLDQGLVARTWGNVSCRIDEKRFAITPSGLDYVGMTAKDIAIMDMDTGEWSGKRKPSGEKGVHCAAYQVFPKANFVIHTHQTYATAIGLAGFETLNLSVEEEKSLGGIALAGYGLPGTKKLTNNVKTALQSGANVVFMAHHGVLICGSDREDALKKAILLEEICKRSLKGQPAAKADGPSGESGWIKETLGQQCADCAVLQSKAVMQLVLEKKSIPAQVDDMAQMIGAKVPFVKKEITSILGALNKSDAILVEGIGAVVKAEDKEDREALKLLVDKAAICYLHTMACERKAKLSWIDTHLMRFVYRKKYSKQKKA